MKHLFSELAKYRWSFGALQVWAEFDFHCAYCGADLIHSFDRYALGNVDHLLPRGRYPQLVDSPTNHVLSCWTCNRIKRHWDANTRIGAAVYTAGNSLTPEQRRELIDRAKAYIVGVREEKSAEVRAISAAILDFRLRRKDADTAI